jgi:hypothetical protein
LTTPNLLAREVANAKDLSNSNRNISQIDSTKALKKSSSALQISDIRKKLGGSYSLNQCRQSNKDMRKYYKPKVLVNPKEINWLSYAKVRNFNNY